MTYLRNHFAVRCVMPDAMARHLHFSSQALLVVVPALSRTESQNRHNYEASMQRLLRMVKILTRPDKDNESSTVGAVANLERNDIHLLMLRNAQQIGYRLNDEHFEVIDTLIEYYRRTAWAGEYQCSSRQIRFLAKRYLDRGGSRYLHRLFNNDEDFYGALHAIQSLVAVTALEYGDVGDSNRPPATEKPVRSIARKRVRRLRKPVRNA